MKYSDDHPLHRTPADGGVWSGLARGIEHGAPSKEHDDPPVPGGYTGQQKLLKPGIYRIHWSSGGSSLAAVGVLTNGQNWFAPVNCTAEPESPGNVVFTRTNRSVTRFEPIKHPTLPVP